MKLTRNQLLLAIPLIAVSVLSGCAKTASTTTDSMYVPTAADVTATATLADLQNGRTLYISNCGSCHSLALPESYTAAQWRSLLPNMTPRTSLTSAQVTLVTKYVTKGK